MTMEPPEDFNYPTSINALKDWQRRFGTTKEDARRRFVQFIILRSMAESTDLAPRVAFKGGNALRFLYGNPRSTLDLDFSAELDFPDDAVAIKGFMEKALRGLESRYTVKARCRKIRRKPPGLGRTMMTYSINVCYQLPGDRLYQNIDEWIAAGKPVNDVVEVEISLYVIACETS